MHLVVLVRLWVYNTLHFSCATGHPHLALDINCSCSFDFGCLNKNMRSIYMWSCSFGLGQNKLLKDGNRVIKQHTRAFTDNCPVFKGAFVRSSITIVPNEHRRCSIATFMLQAPHLRSEGHDRASRTTNTIVMFSNNGVMFRKTRQCYKSTRRGKHIADHLAARTKSRVRRSPEWDLLFLRALAREAGKFRELLLSRRVRFSEF